MRFRMKTQQIVNYFRTNLDVRVVSEYGEGGVATAHASTTFFNDEKLLQAATSTSIVAFFHVSL